MEKENYTAYDLEPEEKNPSVRKVESPSPKKENSTPKDISDTSDSSDISDTPGEAETELQRLIKKLGAEKIVELIRGNRNAAIKQILDEMQQQSDTPLQSGISAGHYSRSIFDLASQA